MIEAANYIRQRANLGLEANDWELGIICGSGLGLLGDQLTETIQISYDDIPHFERKGHVIGHAGQLVIGTLEVIVFRDLLSFFNQSFQKMSLGQKSSRYEGPFSSLRRL